jgi:hypothetical protein
MPIRLAHSLIFVLSLVCAARPAAACPFCAATSPTICEELAPAEVVVIARAVSVVSTERRARYEIVHVIRGTAELREVGHIDLRDSVETKIGSLRLLTGCGAPKLTWSELHGVSERGREYVSKATSFSPEDPGRLAFFHDYLEDAEEQIAQDAYNEFASANYAEVKKLRDRMDRRKLLARATDPKTPANRRGLLFTMLGICGAAEEAAALEAIVRSGGKESPGYFDAVLAAYLSLRGAIALDVIDAQFLRPDSKAGDSTPGVPATLADSHAAIRALRFHLEEQHGVPKERILTSFRLLIDRPELASVVIADLARWEDWQALPRLVELFKTAEKDASGLRVQVVNYLLTCPLPEAARELEALEHIAPKEVARARILGVYGKGGAPPPPR